MKLIRLALLLTLAGQMGLPLVAAQTCAWIQMVRSGQSIAEAIEGEHPCHICLKIRESKPTSSLSVKIEARLDWHVVAHERQVSQAPASSIDSPVPAVLSPVVAPTEPPPPRLLS